MPVVVTVNRIPYRNGRGRGFLILFLAAVLIGCDNTPISSAPPTPTLIPFSRYQNDQALELLYPSAWQFNIVTEGVLAFASPEALDLQLSEPAPSVVIYRQRPGAGVGDFAIAFEDFLKKGPLVTGYHAVEEVAETSLGGQNALEILVQSDTVADTPVTQVLIVGTQTTSGATYIITATAPQENWEEWLPNFRVMLASVKFHE